MGSLADRIGTSQTRITLTPDLLIQRDGWTLGYARQVINRGYFAHLGDDVLGPAKNRTELIRLIRSTLRVAAG